MVIKVQSAHITPADGNIFIDLGFDPEVAAALKANSDRIIEDKLASNELPKEDESQYSGSKKG